MSWRRLTHVTLVLIGASTAIGIGCAQRTGDYVADETTATFPAGTVGKNCTVHNDGCPCLQEGLSEKCGVVKSMTGDSAECFDGFRTCRGGLWGKCDPVGLSTRSVSTGLNLLTLATSADDCENNPCDPYCSRYQDTPVGVDAGPGFSLTADGGLTLVAGANCAGSPNVDDDGDGWTEAQGDCNDCSALINPGAYDWPGNGFDDDCDGTVDNPPALCDGSLSLASSSGDDYVKALDLCQFTTASATGAAKKWGVITGTPKLVRADTTSSPKSEQYGIMSYFGNSAYNGVKKGANLAVFSSGKARYPSQSGYTKPKGWCGSYSAGTSSSVPCGLDWNKTGCPGGKAGNDSSGLTFQVRVPTNAQCISFRFHYLSSEYPEWVCTPYNDVFIAMLKSKSMSPGSGCCGASPNVNCNISYGTSFTPVSVNNNLFVVPGCTSCTNPVLAGTGFDGSCSGYIGGGSTGWLYSYAPVTPGEIATFHSSIWDTGDNVWDSTVLMDSWDWYPGTCAIGTSPSPPTQLPAPPISGPTVASVYTREFEASCSPGFTLFWRDFTYTAMEPSDSKIVFTVQNADTLADLSTSPQHGLTTAQGDPLPTTHASDVKSVLGDDPVGHKRWLRVKMAFEPASDTITAPTLFDWKQAYECAPSE